VAGALKIGGPVTIGMMLLALASCDGMRLRVTGDSAGPPTSDENDLFRQPATDVQVVELPVIPIPVEEVAPEEIVEPVCNPECQDKECGWDGCEGSCGDCPSDAECQDGVCVELFSPDGCSPCDTDWDCGNLTCYPLGGGAFCFDTCGTNDDCPSGWMCYQLTNEGKQCIPMSFGCDAKCLVIGCPPGEVCDQDTGKCAVGGAECAPCLHDWQCAQGLRCYQEGKYCAPGCAGTGCPGGSVCEQVNPIPFQLCISVAPECCFGPECTSCPPSAPFMYEGACVECLNSSHCMYLGPEAVCDLLTYSCVSGDPPECGYCADPYPACVQINGVWACVQCTDDTYCGPDGTCDLNLYACSYAWPSLCGEDCLSDSDCQTDPGILLACDADTGCCYDPMGWCDGVNKHCNYAAGSSCIDLMGVPMPGGIGMCSCTDPLDQDEFMMCFMMEGACESPECFGEMLCVDPTVMPIVPGPMLNEPVCMSPALLLDGMF